MSHPLVSTLYKRRKERSPLIQLAVREGQGSQLETWLEDGSVDLAILYRTSPTPQNGDTYLVETSTYLVSAAGDRLTSRPTVPFSTLHNLPLVLFCRPNSWRNQLEQISADRGVSLNVALEADSLSLQTHIVSEGGIYALLGPYAIAAASKDRRLRSSKLVAPVVTRHIALAMSRHGEVTLPRRAAQACSRPPKSKNRGWQGYVGSSEPLANACPLWVISGHFAAQSSCPLYPRKRTCAVQLQMSALGQ